MSTLARRFGGLSVALIYVSGLLYHTAILNVGASGIPLYFVGVVAMSVSLAVAGRGVCRSDLMLFVVCTGALLLTTLAHVLMSKYSGSEFTQLAARIFFLFSFVVCINYVKMRDSDGKIFVCTIRLLTIAYVLCGFYELYAKRAGLPVPMEWLANNKSYSVASGLNGGWLGDTAVRVRTFWAEPSSSVIPVLLSLFFVIRGWVFKSRLWNFAWFILIFIYVLITGSRNIYLCATAMVVVALSVWAVSRVSQRLVRPFFIACVAISVLTAFTWQLIVLYFFDDLSATGRASSVAVGIGIWVHNMFFGTGYNTFEVESYRYSLGGAIFTGESIIQNSILANLQQAGIVGAAAVFYPLFRAIKRTSSQLYLFAPFWVPVLILSAVSAGLEYSSAFWLLLSVFYAADFEKGQCHGFRAKAGGLS